MEEQLTRMFIQTANLGYQAGIVVSIVLIVRYIAVVLKVPRKYICMLWLFVFIRLVCPFQLESVLSLLPAQTMPIPQEIGYMEQPVIRTYSDAVNRSANPILQYAVSETGTNPVQMWIALFTMVWLAGVAVLLVYSAASILRLKRRTRFSAAEGENVYRMDGIQTAFVLGFRHARIYLPSDLKEEAKEYVISHEKQHIRRKDHIIKFAAFCLACIYWFHPFVWLAFYYLGRDIEFACDEAVICNQSKGYRKEYAAALLELSTAKKQAFAIPLAFSEGGPQKRIKNIITYKKPLRVTLIIGVALVLICSVGLLTDPVTKKEEKGAVAKKTAEGANKEGGETDIPQQESNKLTVINPQIDRNADTGADGAGLYYADENIFIFGGYFGLFVYSKEENRIQRGVDLEPIGCHYTQGDQACEISVSKDGKKVYLHPMNKKNMYVYDVVKNTLSEELFNLEGIERYNGINENGNAEFEQDGKKMECALSQPFGLIGSLGFYGENGLVTKIFEEEPYEEVEYFAPEDIYDLKRAEITLLGKHYSVEDETSLDWIEQHFSNAVPLKGEWEANFFAGCPFYDRMYLIRTDGTVGMLYPATDSCTIFRTEKGDYDYAEGDNSEFWKLFGIVY